MIQAESLQRRVCAPFLLAQRVSRAFRDSITQIPLLGRRLFFRVARLAGCYEKPTAERIRNPLFTFRESFQVIQDEFVVEIRAFGRDGNSNHIRATVIGRSTRAARKVYPAGGYSWEKMLLAQSNKDHESGDAAYKPALRGGQEPPINVMRWAPNVTMGSVVRRTCRLLRSYEKMKKHYGWWAQDWQWIEWLGEQTR